MRKNLVASLAVGVPLVVGVVATVLVLIWLPQIPNPAAIHWGFDGAPDGFAPRWVYVPMTAGLAGVLPLVMGATVVRSAWQTVYTTNIRMIVAILGVAGGPHYLLLVAALLAILPIAFAVFHVSVGREGLLVRSVLGWPWRRIDLSQIASVEVVDVHPFQQWGGWGWRSNPQGTAVVTRKGPALQTTLTNGRVFVVTCEDARRGAATLTALVEREREGRDAATS